MIINKILDHITEDKDVDTFITIIKEEIFNGQHGNDIRMEGGQNNNPREFEIYTIVDGRGMLYKISIEYVKSIIFSSYYYIKIEISNDVFNDEKKYLMDCIKRAYVKTRSRTVAIELNKESEEIFNI